MGELISRNAAIDALEAKKDKTAKGDMGCFYNTIIQNDIDVLMKLPPAQPEHPKGEWKTERHYFFHVDLPICSHCLQFSPFKYDFCPRCGADMREVAKVNDRT